MVYSGLESCDSCLAITIRTGFLIELAPLGEFARNISNEPFQNAPWLPQQLRASVERVVPHSARDQYL